MAATIPVQEQTLSIKKLVTLAMALIAAAAGCAC